MFDGFRREASNLLKPWVMTQAGCAIFEQTDAGALILVKLLVFNFACKSSLKRT